MVTGTILLMWMGEKVTESGIGNGISLIIMVGIISRLPFVIGNEVRAVMAGEKLFISEIILMGIMFLVICFWVLLTQGTRKFQFNTQKELLVESIWWTKHPHSFKGKYSRCNANHFCSINNVYSQHYFNFFLIAIFLPA